MLHTSEDLAVRLSPLEVPASMLRLRHLSYDQKHSSASTDQSDRQHTKVCLHLQ